NPYALPGIPEIFIDMYKVFSIDFENHRYVERVKENFSSWTKKFGDFIKDSLRKSSSNLDAYEYLIEKEKHDPVHTKANEMKLKRYKDQLLEAYREYVPIRESCFEFFGGRDAYEEYINNQLPSIKKAREDLFVERKEQDGR
ncbi:hypothetical protein KY342_04520, partial [Candidatus Woesearchaeota archaeon]|nr:hypothetical protein [Candidatus Woesearchaeota archaeon]